MQFAIIKQNYTTLIIIVLEESEQDIIEEVTFLGVVLYTNLNFQFYIPKYNKLN